MHVGHIGDAASFEQPAHLLEIRRQDVHRFALEQLAEMVALVVVLPGGDRRGGRGGDAAQGIVVFGRHRVFQPQQVVRLAGAREPDGIIDAVVPVAVNRQIDVLADGLAQGRDQARHQVDLATRERAVVVVKRVLCGHVEVKLQRLEPAALHLQRAPGVGLGTDFARF